MRKRRHLRNSPRSTSFGEPDLGAFEMNEPPDPDAHLIERVCADCEGYAPVSTMITMPDGRVICTPCWRRIKIASAKSAQPSMFEVSAQERLF